MKGDMMPEMKMDGPVMPLKEMARKMGMTEKQCAYCMDEAEAKAKNASMADMEME